jgi:hypothetical protein
MPNLNDLSTAGKKQFEIVLETFKAGKLRGINGKTVTDKEQAIAIGYSEGKLAEKRGTTIRTWKGRTRRRPNLKKS